MSATAPAACQVSTKMSITASNGTSPSSSSKSLTRDEKKRKFRISKAKRKAKRAKRNDVEDMSEPEASRVIPSDDEGGDKDTVVNKQVTLKSNHERINILPAKVEMNSKMPNTASNTGEKDVAPTANTSGQKKRAQTVNNEEAPVTKAERIAAQERWEESKTPIAATPAIREAILRGQHLLRQHTAKASKRIAKKLKKNGDDGADFDLTNSRPTFPYASKPLEQLTNSEIYALLMTVEHEEAKICVRSAKPSTAVGEERHKALQRCHQARKKLQIAQEEAKREVQSSIRKGANLPPKPHPQEKSKPKESGKNSDKKAMKKAEKKAKKAEEKSRNASRDAAPSEESSGKSFAQESLERLDGSIPKIPSLRYFTGFGYAEQILVEDRPLFHDYRDFDRRPIFRFKKSVVVVPSDSIEHHCMCCSDRSHQTSSCPWLKCENCSVHGDHFSHSCSSSPGSSQSGPPTSGNIFSCLEAASSLISPTQEIPISCYSCGSDQHLGGDCPKYQHSSNRDCGIHSAAVLRSLGIVPAEWSPQTAKRKYFSDPPSLFDHSANTKALFGMEFHPRSFDQPDPPKRPAKRPFKPTNHVRYGNGR